MRRRLIIGLISLALFVGAAWAQAIKITVTNPATEVRNLEPLVVAWADVARTLGAPEVQKLRLIDEKGRSIAFQVDDMDGDGSFDELAFQSDVRPGASAQFILTAGADTLPPPHGPLRTDAQNLKKLDGVPRFLDDDDGPGSLRSESHYPFDGVGWESELIGYRLYLDERNAMDIQAKRTPGLHWKFIGSTGVNYQLESHWGMDVLHVGQALGFGGVAFWAGDAMVKPEKLDRRRCRVLARGPVRTVVRVDYDGWLVAGTRKNLTSMFVQYAGDRAFEHRLLLRSPGSDMVAAGIVRHEKGAVQWSPAECLLTSFGAQARSGDGLFMAMAAEPRALVKRGRGAFDDFVVLALESGKPTTILLVAAWEGEGSQHWDADELKRHGERLVKRLLKPLTVRVEPS